MLCNKMQELKLTVSNSQQKHCIWKKKNKTKAITEAFDANN